MIRVLTWYWQQKGGRTLFKPHHVNIWAAMVRRNCTLDIEIACVTDLPEGIDPSIRIIKPPGFHEGLQTSRWRGGRPSCYRRLAMFGPDAGEIFGERFVSMDLDVVIGGNIDAILSRPEDFVICGPSQIGPRWYYNGSMMLMTAGARPCVYEDFTPEAAEIASSKFVGSDQAWIAYSLGQGEATWSADEGVIRWGMAEQGAMMFFPGTIKPWTCIADEWIGEHYRLDSGRKAIILGERQNVWDEAKAARAAGPFDILIALPRSARKWNGRVDYVAENMGHAKQIARMMGCELPVICGA